MRQDASLSHSRWECKYHVVFIPKYRKKVIFGQIRRDLGSVLKRLARQKESRIDEGHLMSDHVHMMISIPPKYAVSQVVGYTPFACPTLRPVEPAHFSPGTGLLKAREPHLYVLYSCSYLQFFPNE
jgi:hypothetical protein